MNQQLKIAAVAVFAFALTACSGVGSSVPGTSQNSMPQSVSRGGADMNLPTGHLMRTRFSFNAVQPNAHLTYRNGLVERKPGIFVVYWGFNASGSDPSGEQTYMTAFLTGVGGSSWLNIDHQYYQIVAGITQHIKNPPGQLLGTWVDSTNPVPGSPTQSQVEAEAVQAEAHFGYNKNASYVIATPHNHNTPGFGTQFCAFHWQKSTPGGSIAYTDLPYMTDAGQSCGQNFINPGTGGLLDGVSIVEGHELAESQTDPFPFSGWYDNLNGEIGDICAWLQPPAGDITLSTGTFAVQGLWSNKNNACVIHFP